MSLRICIPDVARASFFKTSGGFWADSFQSKHALADRVTISAVQTNPDQQSNSDKHPGNYIFALFTLNCMFTLSGNRASPFEN